jgi:glycerophosphoryl diester phosphodiesterase
MKRSGAILAGIGTFVAASALFLAPLAASPAPKVSGGAAPPVLVAGHRGTTVGADENTLKAMDYAKNNGADALETDVRLTSDKKMVIMHDATLNRTTNCTGRVADRSLAFIKRCTTNRGHHPPSLRELMQHVDRYSSSIDVWPELKGTWTQAQVDHLVDEITSYSVGDLVVQSFSDKNLMKVLVANDRLSDEQAGRHPDILWVEGGDPTQTPFRICDRYDFYANSVSFLKASFVDAVQMCKQATLVVVYGQLDTTAEYQAALDTHARWWTVEDVKSAKAWLATR